MANMGSKVVVDFVKDVVLENVDIYNYSETKKNVDMLFSKYRQYKEKKDIILKRTNSGLSFDNLGIYSSTPGDPVGNRVEQTEKYYNFIDTIDKIYELYSYQLTKDEKLIYKKMLLSKYTDIQMMEILNVSSYNGLYNRKQSCYIKVARWFDLEVYC